LGAGNKSYNFYWYESVCWKWAVCFTQNSGFVYCTTWL